MSPHTFWKVTIVLEAVGIAMLVLFPPLLSWWWLVALAAASLSGTWLFNKGNR